MTARVLIADDQEMVRAGFRMLLDSQPDIEVVGEAGNGEEALAVARRQHPDVVLMDVRMPVLDGIAATRQLISDPSVDTRVLVLTTFDLDEYVYGALRAGASGFLLKDAPPEQLIDGIHTVAAGEALLAPSITQRVIHAFVSLPAKPQPMPELDELTAREREVLELLARGLSNAEIASQLVITQTTTKTHVARVLAKLRLRDRVHAVIYAYEVGIITPGETAVGTRR
ncbi:MAG TPA: response regulator transcription factor [Gaiellales bacterium]|nr:response regulator transcription factor [Gaiellales bacterium]